MGSDCFPIHWQSVESGRWSTDRLDARSQAKRLPRCELTQSWLGRPWVLRGSHRGRRTPTDRGGTRCVSCRCRVAGAVRQTTAQANSPLESAESESAHDGLALRSVSRFDHITKSQPKFPPSLWVRCGSRNFAPCSWPPRSVAAIAGRARQQRPSICGLIARSHIAGFQFSGIVRFSHGTEFQNCFQGACTRCNLYISIYNLSVSVNKLDSACCFVACSRRPCPPAGILHPARTIFIRFQS